MLHVHFKKLLFSLLVAGIAAPLGQVLSQTQGPFLEIESLQDRGEVADPVTKKQTARVRVWFRAYTTKAKDREYTGNISLEYVYERLYVNNEKARLQDKPMRVGDKAEPVPMLFLLAIDVSGSMGSQASERGRRQYQRRMAPLVSALRDFVTVDNASLYVRLYPWSHELPARVDVPGANQGLSLWEGRYLPLDEAGRSALLQGLSDIDLYVREGNRNVHTALYGVCLRGVDELKSTLRNPEFTGAKPVLVVLTDGKDDPQRARPEYQDLNVQRVKTELQRSDIQIPVYTIAFGVDSDRARSALADISGVTAAKPYEVAEGEQAGPKLREVYDSVVEHVGSQWYIDIDMGVSLTDLARHPRQIVFVQGDEERPELTNNRMLLFPSALVGLNRGRIGIVLVISGVVLLILMNVWYFTRPKEDLGDEFEREGIDDDEVEDQGATSAGVSIKEYLRRTSEEDN